MCELEFLDAIIEIMTNLIERGYRGSELVVQLHHLIDAWEFISPPLIRGHQLY